MSRPVTLLVAFAAAALAASPALAAHKFSCYDYAWQSKDMKDCLANPAQWEKTHHMAMHKPMHHAMHKPAHKPMKATKAKAMKMKTMEKKPEAMTPAPAPAPAATPAPAPNKQ
jgi:hypothetical protein